jgi:hypothetical protein
LLFGGLGMIALGLFLCWLFIAGGVMRGTYTRDVAAGDKITDAGTMNLVPLAITVVVVGVLMVGGSLVYGGMFVRNSRTGTRRKIEYFRVLARLATDRYGNLLTSDWEIEAADRVRYYVRGTFPNGPIDEYEVPEEVYFACGEGMTGEAEVQGRWIGRFVPYVGSPAGGTTP